MISLDLDAIKARCEAVRRKTDRDFSLDDDPPYAAAASLAREDVPALIARIEELEAVVVLVAGVKNINAKLWAESEARAGAAEDALRVLRNHAGELEPKDIHDIAVGVIGEPPTDDDEAGEPS